MALWKKRVVVLRSRPLDLSAARGAGAEQMSGAPAGIVRNLRLLAHVTSTSMEGSPFKGSCAGLVLRLTITRVPVLIGEGIPLFGSLPGDVRLRHIATQHYPSGLVKSEYRIAA